MDAYYLFCCKDTFDYDVLTKFGMHLDNEYNLELSDNDLKRILALLKADSSPKSFRKMLLIRPSDNVNNWNNADGFIFTEFEKMLVTLNCLGSIDIHVNTVIGFLFSDKDSYQNAVITELKGSNGWPSLKEFFEAINAAQISYVVLRKYEELPVSFIDGDKDLDVLCFDHDEFVAISNAKKRSIGISGYKLLVGNEWIPLDVRFVGDCYYDSSWERDILNKRILYNGCVFVMDPINYLYSILYHVLTQKYDISDYYNKLILCLLNKIYNIKAQSIGEKELLDYLMNFMYKNRYRHLKPLDYSVVQNINNIKVIRSRQFYPTKRKIRMINFATKLRRCPQKLYNYINTMR